MHDKKAAKALASIEASLAAHSCASSAGACMKFGRPRKDAGVCEF